MSAYALLYINLELERQADMIPDHVSTTTNLTSDVLTSLYHAATLGLEHYYMHSSLTRIPAEVVVITSHNVSIHIAQAADRQTNHP